MRYLKCISSKCLCHVFMNLNRTTDWSIRCDWVIGFRVGYFQSLLCSTDKVIGEFFCFYSCSWPMCFWPFGTHFVCKNGLIRNTEKEKKTSMAFVYGWIEKCVTHKTNVLDDSIYHPMPYNWCVGFLCVFLVAALPLLGVFFFVLFFLLVCAKPIGYPILLFQGQTRVWIH